MVNRLGASLTDDARVIIYDSHMFIVQATGDRNWQLIYSNWDMLRTWLITNTILCWKCLPATQTL